jgi:hypothetical protein
MHASSPVPDESSSLFYKYVQYVTSYILGLFAASAPESTPEVLLPTPKSTLFGEKIDVVMAREQENGTVPVFLQQCYDYLQLHAHEEGIFRIPGSAKDIKDIAALVNAGKFVNFDQYESCTIASVFKKFYRELPEPLLTTSLHDNWVSALTISDQTERTQRVLELFRSLPQHHQQLFMTLFQLLASISSPPHLATSRMTGDNLSYIFGLNIMKQDCFDAGKMAKVCKMCIDEFPSIKEAYLN